MLTDTTLQKNVIEEISWDPTLSHAEIGVAAKNGVVTLTGNVRTYAEKHVAEEAAHRVAGAKVVANELQVQLLPDFTRSDTDIGHAIMNAFQWNVAVPSDKVRADVENGWVTLRGAVDWDFQRRAAEGSIRPLAGVRGLSNLIVVAPRASVENVKDKIEAAFRRHADIDADRIQVTAADGTVTLSGAVRSWAERNDAERAAWAAPGVREVVDQMTLTV